MRRTCPGRALVLTRNAVGKIESRRRLCLRRSIRRSANRSPSHIEPVSGMPKRKLENGEQRLARQSHQSSPEIPEFAGQRLGSASITRGNVGSSRTAGNRLGETALAGWGGRFELTNVASKIGL